MRTVEINGIQIEFDEKAFLKQELRVGDAVSVLVKKYSNVELYKGVVTDILPFEKGSCIGVMWVEAGYSDIEIKTAAITENTEDYQIIKTDGTFLPFTKEHALELFDKKIRCAEHELAEAKEKKAYFLKYYNQYIKPLEEDDE